jgi:hypothetical protein
VHTDLCHASGQKHWIRRSASAAEHHLSLCMYCVLKSPVCCCRGSASAEQSWSVSW